jgi:hypothetical protein
MQVIDLDELGQDLRGGTDGFRDRNTAAESGHRAGHVDHRP